MFVQRDGVKFLFSRFENLQGAMLNDDMGLGKTVQVSIAMALPFLSLSVSVYCSFLFLPAVIFFLSKKKSGSLNTLLESSPQLCRS